RPPRNPPRAACGAGAGHRCWIAVQTLVELLLELKALVAAPDPRKQLERITALLADPRIPSEFQVGRHYVARLLGPAIERQINDLDPRARAAAIELVQAVFPRGAAARVLRRVVKDPDGKVRGAARSAVRALGLDDVAPPDIR